MDWLTPLLTLGSQFLGNFFGKDTNTTQNKNMLAKSVGAEQTSLDASSTQNSTNTTTGSQNSDTTQSQNTSQQSSTTGSQSTNGTTSSTGSTTGSQSSTGSSDEQQNTDTTGIISRLDSGTKDMLTQNVQSLLSAAGGRSDIITSRLSEVASPGASTFDPAQFVEGVMAQARVSARDKLDSDIAKIGDRAGGSSSGNSAAALLKNRVLMDQEANLASVKANASATAAEIMRTEQESRTNQLNALASAGQNELSSQIGNLLNAGQTETSTLIGRTTGTTAGQQTNQQQQTQNTSNQQNTTNQQNQTQNTQMTGSSSTDQTSSQTSVGKVTEQSKQNQKSATSQQQQQKTVTDQKTNEKDWSNFFKGVGDIFATTF